MGGGTNAPELRLVVDLCCGEAGHAEAPVIVGIAGVRVVVVVVAAISRTARGGIAGRVVAVPAAAAEEVCLPLAAHPNSSFRGMPANHSGA